MKLAAAAKDPSMLTLLDWAQMWMFDRFLKSQHTGTQWIVEPDIYSWATGGMELPGIAVATLPGHE